MASALSWADGELRRRGLYKPAPWMASYVERGAGRGARSAKELMEDFYMAFLTDRDAGEHTRWWRECARRLAAGPGAGDPGLPSPEVQRSRVPDLLIPGGVDFLRGGGDAWSRSTRRRAADFEAPIYANRAGSLSHLEPMAPGGPGSAPGDAQDDGDAALESSSDDEDCFPDEAPPALKGGDIDALWLERKVSVAFPELDPQQCRKLAEETFEILAGVGGDHRDAQNRIAALFDDRELGLVRLLVCERDQIVRCTRLAREEDEERRRKMAGETVATVTPT